MTTFEQIIVFALSIALATLIVVIYERVLSLRERLEIRPFDVRVRAELSTVGSMSPIPALVVSVTGKKQPHAIIWSVWADDDIHVEPSYRTTTFTGAAVCIPGERPREVEYHIDIDWLILKAAKERWPGIRFIVSADGKVNTFLLVNALQVRALMQGVNRDGNDPNLMP